MIVFIRRHLLASTNSIEELIRGREPAADRHCIIVALARIDAIIVVYIWRSIWRSIMAQYYGVVLWRSIMAQYYGAVLWRSIMA